MRVRQGCQPLLLLLCCLEATLQALFLQQVGR
jgi:hypothetical protein